MLAQYRHREGLDKSKGLDKIGTRRTARARAL